MWDVNTGECIRTLPSHSNPVDCVAFSPDGNRIVAGSSGKFHNLSEDATVRVWDANTAECLESIGGYGDVNAIAAAILSFRAIARNDEIVIENGVTGEPVACFPGIASCISTHPSEAVWAAAGSGSYLGLVRLEGGENCE